MNRRLPHAMLVAGALLAPTALAQDSVSVTPCSGGDAPSPWDDATAIFGSEQQDNYVVDLDHFRTSWGNELGIAPIVKSSKGNSGFNNNLLSAQGISRRQNLAVDISSEPYLRWFGQGFGTSNNPAVSTAPDQITVDCPVNQFGVGFAEFATTDFGASYNGVVAASVGYNPSNPGRLYVRRSMAAVNGCDPFSAMASLGFGSVDSDGRVIFRGDGFSVGGGCFGLTVPTTTPPSKNLYWSVAPGARNSAILNVMSDDYPLGLFDTLATTEPVNALATYNTPNLVPASVAGVSGFAIGSNFNTQFVRGLGPVLEDGTHLAVGVSDQRGSIAYTSYNVASIGGVRGTAATIGEDSISGRKDIMNVFGLNALGNPAAGSQTALQLPGSITDNDDLFTTLAPAGTLEMDNYHSQVAFRGGNSQISLNRDVNGDLLAAAQIDHPQDGGPGWPVNAIAVCRVNGTTGAQAWTLAAWNDGVSGKAYTDGNGNVIGHLVPNPTIVPSFNVSMSSPMIDAGGNVWFVSFFRNDLFPATTRVGLFRAVYSPATFSYELELVLRSGSDFYGQNSDTPWSITFIPLTDADSINSSAPWSHNIQEVAHGGGSGLGMDPADTATLGGMVLNCSIQYDRDKDGTLDLCPSAGGTGIDEGYSALLYIGHVNPTASLDPTPVGGGGSVSGTGGGLSGTTSRAKQGQGPLNPCETTLVPVVTGDETSVPARRVRQN